ncbi:acetylornithine deacetylase [Nigerium massiliense]|uniref:acetylornithine deacetylase n=1 Tax=Nigerium massiliense TaxID=1522317 RepID=UPI0005913E62|nr:acetylornithine deacetylase [Nigerium massiliense]
MTSSTLSSPVREWLTKLIAIDSTSRDSNRGVIDLVADHARSLGLEPLIFPTEDGQRSNMIVSVPDKSGSTDGGVMLAGHTDCVPVDGQDWASDPFTVEERDGLLYGRGTADMKGFLAVITAAMEQATRAELSRPLHFGYTYDEELGCRGAQPFVDSLTAAGRVPSVGFVGEPSSMRMIRGHKSVNVIEVTLTGVPAHSSLTAEGVNAIEYGAEVVRYWRERADRWRDEGPYDEAYPITYTTGSVNRIDGGTAQNIVAGRCVVTMEFRAIGATDDAAEIEALRGVCADIEKRMKAENEAASVDVVVLSSSIGLDQSVDADIVELGQELGLAVSDDKVTYGTEAGIYTRGGINCVVCGPGDIAQAHKPDEFVAVDQLAACEEFVGRLISHLSEG